MKYHELTTNANRSSRRVGRGIAAGRGKTAGRGTKGQRSRAGSSAKPGFAGGQTPLMQKLPKLPGFRSHRTPVENVYTGQLEQLKGATIDANTLAEAGLISSAYVEVKLLVKGDLKRKVTVKLPAASASAVEAVQKAGGSFEKAARLSRPKTSTKKQNGK
ncbi:MAG TPA: 50S ribosomal protein L15 [Candidatus Saccharimonadales bacterium]|jgi:large subunit ribosomal protein L15|nr:50S ribosomal protein L15 [Candidatus Saccharimonadales bacterium]